MITDDKKLISVIIPVYNSKNYLENSIQSILAQTYQYLEIIIVDDGSTDGSGEVCDLLAETDDRIVVVHKDNGGQSDARNCGLDIANGEYIAFVDSDDSIDPRMYEILLENMIANEAHISCCGTVLKYEDGRTGYFNDDISYFRVYSKNEAMVEFTNNRIITASLWDKLYHRSVFDGLRLKKGIIYEDFQIIPYCILKADNVVYTGVPLYFYNVTSISTIRGHRSTKLFDIIPVCAELTELYKNVCPEGLPGMENQYIDHCLTLFYASYDDPAWEREKDEIFKILSSVDRKTFADLYPDNKIKLRMVCINQKLYVCLYRIFQSFKAIISK